MWGYSKRGRLRFLHRCSELDVTAQVSSAQQRNDFESASLSTRRYLDPHTASASVPFPAQGTSISHAFAIFLASIYTIHHVA